MNDEAPLFFSGVYWKTTPSMKLPRDEVLRIVRALLERIFLIYLGQLGFYKWGVNSELSDAVFRMCIMGVASLIVWNVLQDHIPKDDLTLQYLTYAMVGYIAYVVTNEGKLKLCKA